MDIAEARAILVVMEAMGKMMVALVDRGALSKPFVKELMIAAAEHLEPVNDDAYLAMMAEQWRESAKLFDGPRRTN